MQGSDDGEHDHDHVNVYLAIAPSNIPNSTVVRIDDRVQYASHVVNIRDDDFGDSRILGGDTALNLPEITQLFYEHFADECKVIAVVSRVAQLTDYPDPGSTRWCATTSAASAWVCSTIPPPTAVGHRPAGPCTGRPHTAADARCSHLWGGARRQRARRTRDRR